MPASPPSSPAPAQPPSGIVRPSTRSQSRMSIGSTGRQLISGISNGRAPSRSSGDDEDGLRTAVRVAVRIRPPLQPTDPGYDLIPQRFQRAMVQTISDTTVAIDSPQGKKVFVFDRIFAPDVQQEGVWDYLQDSISAFVQGYNVSILAYGQSGAGKSYTMGTSDPNEQTTPDVSGVIPRAAVALFEKLSPVTANRTSGARTASTRYSTPLPTMQRQSVAQEKSWSMKATYVEIYNEQLRDLLLPENTMPGDRRQVNIREDTKGRILLTGLQEMPIESVDDLLAALRFGSSIRQTDATAINAKSSRSHAVFSINLVQRKPRTPLGSRVGEKRYSAPVDILAASSDGFITVDSKLHFVDLAGSERLKNTGAYGDRAKEGISINAGLASLGKVISQLSSRQPGSHVSYRDSKLTRLLQDSLGGNAVTYMVACVNPAEFHLSETLNTVQYAQRARAIQSKPQIQEVTVDGDLRALVDRLRAEISFLRNQVEMSGDLSSVSNRHSIDRPTEKAVELQNQLLDVQENYSALSQRHAKLISEITKARDSDTSDPPVNKSNAAEDRLARSNSFAEAVEQVVLEYEKTIQSLEASLSGTRSNLSSTESALLEKESRLVYLETINSQLQNRVQKLTDRESSTEIYLADLEGRLNGHTSGEERSSAAISELRKELSRVRENEASCEDYISTLEERLAEADQGMEIMQRELERLENVVERQRSLGKLDNLLHELDNLTGVPPTPSAPTDVKMEDKMVASDSPDQAPAEEEGGTTRPQTARKIVQDASPVLGDADTTESVVEHRDVSAADSVPHGSPSVSDAAEPSDAATDLKYHLDRTAQELVNYKGLYHSTLSDYTEMNARYERALRDLHELQDQLDEHRHGRNSLMLTNSDDLPPPSPQSASTPTVSTPLVQQMGSHPIARANDTLLAENSIPRSWPKGLGITNSISGDSDLGDAPSEILISDGTPDMDAEFSDLEARYMNLQEEHRAVLEIVDDLKATISKSRLDGVTSPTGGQILRRKSSQNLIASDRANRAFKGLRSIAITHLIDNDDAREVFDVNVNAAMHELQTRSERIQELEQEIGGLRKDVDAKTAMINGLARERSSITSSPMDMSVVSSLQNRLAESEDELQKARSRLRAQEEEFQQQVTSLKTNLKDEELYHSPVAAGESPVIVQQPSSVQTDSAVKELNREISEQIAQIEQLLQTKDDEDIPTLPTRLDRVLVFVEHLTRVSPKLVHEDLAPQWTSLLSRMKDRLVVGRDSARVQHQQLRDHEEKAAAQNAQFKRLIKVFPAEVEEGDKRHSDIFISDSADLELLVDAVTSNVEGVMRSLEQNQAEKVALQNALLAGRKETARCETVIHDLEGQLEAMQANLDSELENAEVAHKGGSALQDKIRGMEELNAKLQAELVECKAKIKTLEDEIVVHSKKVDAQKLLVVELQELHAMSQKELDDLIKKEAKQSGIVDQLEHQLASSYDQYQDSQDRSMQLEEDIRSLEQERATLLANHEASARASAQQIESLMNEANALQLKLADAQLELNSLPQGSVGRAQRSNSVSSTNLRKSASATSLPSPPPVIPLPPLPPSQASASGVPSAATTTAPIPPSTPTISRRPSKDYVVTHLEDQEARIKTLEKQLQAEKALTSTLEEALTDCEKTLKQLHTEKDNFQRKANQVQQELDRTRNESQSSRYSTQAVEDERLARLKAEKAIQQLEERMQDVSKKGRGRSMRCF
ncbi:hypothetical protein DRE_04126 [Drechslerella stenobrocha 248]|uniref:Kinesin motor domain-containing protein n=1 Tax=Drechslerella stenobrocha 248 TaxID=1043628 RepID=W7HTE9_9PEZI|nr:hypothetical protein DRE_04126 [Drechslerella stenobrocha 248]